MNLKDLLTLYDFKTYCKTIVIKRVWHWHKYRWKNQQNQVSVQKLTYTYMVTLSLVITSKQFNTEREVFSISGPRVTRGLKNQLKISSLKRNCYSINFYDRVE